MKPQTSEQQLLWQKVMKHETYSTRRHQQHPKWQKA
jgi:hypothetical protein